MISDWLQSNKFRAFPFVEDSSFILQGTDQVFPMAGIVDFQMHDLTNDTNQDWEVTLTSIGRSSNQLYVTFSYRGRTFKSDLPDAGAEVVKCSIVAATTPVAGEYISGWVKVCPAVLTSTSFSVPNNTAYPLVTPPVVLPTRVVHMPLGRGITSISGVDAEGSRVSVGSPQYLPLHVGPGCYSDLRVYNDVVNLEVSDTAGLGQCCQDQSLDDSCKFKLLFINGQVANVSGNIDLAAGPGIDIMPSGETWVAELGTHIPSITIKASPSLLAFLR